MRGLSKKNIILFVICILLVGGTYFFVTFKNRKTVYIADETQQVKNADVIIGKIAELDSDNDGLKDWEESLWKTEAKNPDSDGDGTRDGEEVLSSRDPTMAGPDDKFDPTKDDSGHGLNATETLARESFGQYLKARDSGGSLSAEEAGSIIQDLVTEQKDKITPRVYSQNDIIVSERNDQTAIRDFGNALGEIHKKSSPAKVENEVVLLAQALQKEDPEIPIKLQNISRAYETTAKLSLALPAPKGGETAHLKLINALSRMSATVRALAYVYEDPVITLVGIKEYTVGVNQLREALLTMTGYFERAGVFFENNESGYLVILQAQK